MIPPCIDPTSTPAWRALREVADDSSLPSIRHLLSSPRDFLRLQVAGIDFDFSRQRLESRTFALLVDLAQQLEVEVLRDAMYAGERVNVTEDRAVLHTALRTSRDARLSVGDQDVIGDVQDVLDRMMAFAERVRAGEWLGADRRPITDVVNIGIGGSDLGPAMAYRALRSYRTPGLACHFVSNVDPADVVSVVTDLDPATTLFIVASKTFSTQETMTNANFARRWLTSALGEDAVARHFVAVSTNESAVVEFGIDPNSVFGFWDWVGGRYSLTSAIGLSTLLAIGSVNFRALLDGFAAMDEHFRTAPVEANVPMVMGLAAVWNRNFLQIPTTAILPYSNDLSRFPAYLQQLIMESNGKSVRRDGAALDYATGAIVWGEPGTNGQHSFYQLLHQGTDPVACDVIFAARPTGLDDRRELEQHDMLVANALAQAAVLSCGIDEEELRASRTPADLIAHKVIAGNRPTNVIMLSELTPFTLGALISAYEHSVFVQGAVWQINSFDQWGVELGKKVANGILHDIHQGTPADASLDPATRVSLRRFLENRRPEAGP